MAFDYAAAKKAGYTDQEIKAYIDGKNKKQSIMDNPVLDFLVGAERKFGQDVGAALAGPQIQSMMQENEAQAQRFENMAQNEKDPQKKKLLYQSANNIRSAISAGASQQAGQYSQDVTQNPLWRSLGVASDIAFKAETPEAAAKLAKGAYNLGKSGVNAVKDIGSTTKAVLKNPTMKSASRNFGKGVQSATEAGSKIHWDKPTEAALNSGIDDSLMGQIKTEVQKKLGWDHSVAKATNNFLSGRTPIPETVTGNNGLPMIGDNVLNPQQLAGMRSAVSNEYGRNIFSNSLAQMGGKSGLDVKVANIARGVISKNLHQIAPETLPPDIAMKIYHGFGPIGKIGLPGIAGASVAGSYLTNKAGIPLLKLLGILD